MSRFGTAIRSAPLKLKKLVVAIGLTLVTMGRLNVAIALVFIAVFTMEHLALVESVSIAEPIKQEGIQLTEKRNFVLHPFSPESQNTDSPQWEQARAFFDKFILGNPISNLKNFNESDEKWKIIEHKYVCKSRQDYIIVQIKSRQSS